MAFRGGVEEHLKLHEIWIFENDTAGIGRNVLDISAAEQASRKRPIVLIAIDVSGIDALLREKRVY